MNFQEAVVTCLKNNYANFNGRASRSEYWWFVLFSVIVRVVARLIDHALFHGPFGIFIVIVTFALLLPTLAVGARRLHDMNRSGWWLLISLTIIGAFFPLLYWFCQKGTTGSNQYGEDPLPPEAALKS